MPYTIRVAIDLDLPKLMTIAKDYINEAGRWNGLDFDEKKTMRYIMLAITDRSHNIFIAHDDETREIVGFFWGCITGQVWSNDPIGQEMFMYVTKKARNKSIGKNLIQSFIKWCEVSGCKSIHCGAHSGIDNDKPAVSMYKSLGFKVGGYNFNLKL